MWDAGAAVSVPFDQEEGISMVATQVPHRRSGMGGRRRATRGPTDAIHQINSTRTSISTDDTAASCVVIRSEMRHLGATLAFRM